MQGTVPQHLFISLLEKCLAVRTQPNATTLKTLCVHKEYWVVVRLGVFFFPKKRSLQERVQEFFFFFLNPGQYHKSRDCMGKTTLIR